MTRSVSRARWMTTFLATVVLMLVATVASAAPLAGEIVTIREPDGSRVQIKVWGDEFYSVGETLDGEAVRVRTVRTSERVVPVPDLDARSLGKTADVNVTNVGRLVEHAPGDRRHG